MQIFIMNAFALPQRLLVLAFSLPTFSPTHPTGLIKINHCTIGITKMVYNSDRDSGERSSSPSASSCTMTAGDVTPTANSPIASQIHLPLATEATKCSSDWMTVEDTLHLRPFERVMLNNLNVLADQHDELRQIVMASHTEASGNEGTETALPQIFEFPGQYDPIQEIAQAQQRVEAQVQE